jgi:manganese/zinc/iron transport system substrate-binding protein
MAADTVKQIAGPWADVESLMGPGTDPHLYRASAQDLVRLRRADMIVSVGLHLEGKIENALRMRGKKIVVLGESIPAAKLFEGGAPGLHDPHVWFDPEIWTAASKSIVDALSEAVPEQKSTFEKNYAVWRDEVLKQSAVWKKKIATIPESRRILVTSHDAFRYFGRAFGLHVEGLQGVSTESEAGLKRMNELIELVKARKVQALFAETSVPPAGIERIQSATGVKRGQELYSDALGPDGSGAETYLGMLVHNLKAVHDGLGGAK